MGFSYQYNGRTYEDTYDKAPFVGVYPENLEFPEAICRIKANFYVKQSGPRELISSPIYNTFKLAKEDMLFFQHCLRRGKRYYNSNFLKVSKYF
jgi:hypothetical protein